MIKVGLIDDNYFLLNNYKEFLQDFPDIVVVFTFVSLEELSKEKKQGITVKEPDIVLLDIAVPEQAGIEEVKQLLNVFPGCKIIVMSGVEDQRYIVQSLLSGARGFLAKNARPMEIYSSIQDVY